MSAATNKAILELNNARQELINKDKQDLNSNFFLYIDQIYSPHMQRVDGRVYSSLQLYFQKFKIETDIEILDEVRLVFIEHIDIALVTAGSTNEVRPILEEYILRIKDKKLSILLKEFNSHRTSSPNMCAIAFRTIISLIILEKAKLSHQTSPLATKQDLHLDPDIKNAIKEKIFDEGQTRRLSRFLSGGLKDKCDIAAHKTGDNTIIENDDLSDAVDLLNNLLPSLF